MNLLIRTNNVIWIYKEKLLGSPLMNPFSLQILSTAPKSFNSTSGKPTKADSNDSSNDNSTDANSTQSDYGNDTLSPTGATTVNGNTSFFPGEPTDHILVDVANVQKKKTGGNGDWLFILIVTASSFVLFVALIFVVLVFRHKRKNGVWFKGALINVY